MSLRYIYCVFKVIIRSQMFMYMYGVLSYRSLDEAISSRIEERDLVYMYVHHNKQLIIGTVYTCNLVCKDVI